MVVLTNRTKNATSFVNRVDTEFFEGQLLLEDGGELLMETGDALLLEDSFTIYNTVLNNRPK